LKQKLIGFIVVLILGSYNVQADIIQHYQIEPYLGYGQATTDVITSPYATVPLQPGQTVASFQLAGLEYGARLGIELNYGITLAGDYLSSTISGSGLSELPGQFGIKRKLELTTIGALLGYHLPTTPFRFWMEYLFYTVGSDVGSYNHGQTETGSSGYKSGSKPSYKIGIGYFLNPYLTLSLEYADISLSRSSVNYQDFTYFYGSEDMRLTTVSLGFDIGAFFDGR
jgi:hypothetical protein